MASAKKAPVQTVETTTTSQEEGKKSLRLTAMQLAVLSYYVARQYEKATEDELAVVAVFPESITAPLVTEGLLEVNDNGEIRATGFATKWVLKSTTFGINFAKLFSKEVTPHTSTLHAALMALAPELRARHEESPIYYYKRGSKEVSPFWQQFTDAVNDIDYCRELPPVETKA